MTGFTDRERAAEAKFAHDEDVRFEERMRHVKQLAHWAVTRLGLSDADRQAAYTSEIVRAELGQPGAGLGKIRHDLVQAGTVMSDEEILREATNR